VKTLNLNKIFCVSLKSHNYSQLEAISATYDVSFDFLLTAKSEGCKKIWLPIGGGIVIAGLDTNNMEDVYFSPEYLPMDSKTRKAILNIKPVKTPKMPSFAKTKKKVEKIKIELTVDDVLDKISAFGMSSLTKEELNFLKSFK
jgi:hypothetical protein